MHFNSIFLTIDIEEFFHAELISRKLDSKYIKVTNLEKNVESLIDLCEEFNIKATCFILGEVAQNKPKVVKKLHKAEFEIASHSFSHNLIYNLTPKEFQKDLIKSLDILQDITGEQVIGYRAPSWSIRKENLEWFYDILIDNGIKYSSSIYPGKTFLYGIPEAKNNIHFPFINGEKKRILEIPQRLIHILGIKVGFSGGFYLRFFPKIILKKLFKNEIKKASFFIYLHPYEIDNSIPKFDLGFVNNFIQYYNIKSSLSKLRYILSDFKNSFSTIRDFINEKYFNISSSSI